jgi:hypothetical protein
MTEMYIRMGLGWTDCANFGYEEAFSGNELMDDY